MSAAPIHDRPSPRGVLRRLLIVAALCCARLSSTFAEEPRVSWLSSTADVVQEEPSDSNAQLPLLPPAPTRLPSPADSTVALEEMPAPTTPSGESDMESVLRRLDALERSVGKPEEKTAEKVADKAAEKEPVDEWIDLSTEKWNVKLGGHVQMDQIVWPDHSPQIPAFNYFEFRRLRLLADGVGYGVYDFRIQIDIEPEGEDNVNTPVTVIKDAYFTLHELPNNQRARIGNFFVPFSLEQVTNDTNNIFLERSIPTQGIFAADREVGVALYGINDAKDFTWSFGAFLDSISEGLKERIDNNQGQRLSGRLTYLPYYDEPSNGRYLVHTGVGILHTHDQDDLIRFRARPQIHEGPFLIDTGQRPGSNYTSANLEFATVWGSFSVQSEAFLTHANLFGDNAWVGGAYVYGSYFLTGENRIYERFGQHGAQFGRNVPYSNVFWVPGCCGPGAWEMKARWSNLTLREMDAGEYNDFTFGFNWYWSDRVRIMFDWIHPVTAAGTTPFGATHSDIIGMRFDFNF